MADAELRADSAHVTLPSALSPKSPAGVATSANGVCARHEPGSASEALSGLSAAMQRAVLNYINGRDYVCSLPIDREDEDNDRAEAAYMQVDGALLETPAENLHDLRIKFDAIWSDVAALPNERTLRIIFADFRRLVGDAVSPIFNPTLWLEYFEKRGGSYVARGGEVFLLQPHGAELADNMFELEALRGKPAVDAVIRQRCAQEADHG